MPGSLTHFPWFRNCGWRNEGSRLRIAKKRLGRVYTASRGGWLPVFTRPWVRVSLCIALQTT